MARYLPDPVPSDDNLGTLQGYLARELQRISESINPKSDPGYGSLVQTAGVVVIPLPTTSPILFTAYDAVTPQSPNGVDPVIGSGSLTVLTGGVYRIHFKTTVVNIGNNQQWVFDLYKNGVDTNLGGFISPSNQTEIVTIVFEVMDQAVKGDVYTVFISSPTSSDADVQGSVFSAIRVSEAAD